MKRLFTLLCTVSVLLLSVVPAFAATEYTNQIPLSVYSDGSPYFEAGFADGWRLLPEDGDIGRTSEYPQTVTGWIACQQGDTMYTMNIYNTDDGGDNRYITAYDSEFAFLGVVKEIPAGPESGDTALNGLAVTVDYENTAYIRMCAPILNEYSVITINEELPVTGISSSSGSSSDDTTIDVDGYVYEWDGDASALESYTYTPLQGMSKVYYKIADTSAFTLEQFLAGYYWRSDTLDVANVIGDETYAVSGDTASPSGFQAVTTTGMFYDFYFIFEDTDSFSAGVWVVENEDYYYSKFLIPYSVSDSGAGDSSDSTETPVISAGSSSVVVKDVADRTDVERTSLLDAVYALFGEYTPRTYTVTTYLDDGTAIQSTEIIPGLAGLDYDWIAGVSVFVLVLYCIFRMIGGMFRWK